MDEEYLQYRIDQAHAYLERIRKMGEDCAGLQKLVDDARERADGLRGIDYSAARVQVSPSDDAMPNAVDAVKSRIADYVTALAAYEDERHTANKALMRMEDSVEAKALRLRYLCGWKWERVCMETNYSWDGMMSLRRRALSDFWEVMPLNERDRGSRALPERPRIV